MKPFGREKKIRRNLPDRHPHPKHLIKMWWEDMCSYLDRSAMKQKLKREIQKELEEEEKEQWNI